MHGLVAHMHFHLTKACVVLHHLKQVTNYEYSGKRGVLSFWKTLGRHHCLHVHQPRNMAP